MLTHEFWLAHAPIPLIRFSDARFDAINAAPPEGCQIENDGGLFALFCRRQGRTKLEAIAELVTELRDTFGLQMTGTGVEKPTEWTSDGPDGEGAELLSNLLLMAAYRGSLIGYDGDQLAEFIRAVAPHRE